MPAGDGRYKLALHNQPICYLSLCSFSLCDDDALRLCLDLPVLLSLNHSPSNSLKPVTSLCPDPSYKSLGFTVVCHGVHLACVPGLPPWAVGDGGKGAEGWEAGRTPRAR